MRSCCWLLGLPLGDVITLTDAYYINALPDGQLRVGDKVFSSFSVMPTATGGALAPDASSIRVQGVKVDYGQGYEYGLAFYGGWSAAGQQIVDTLIRFNVAADQPNFINGVTLWMDAGARGINGGQASISESVYGAYPGPELAANYVFRHDGGSLIIDHSDFSQESRTAWVTKDVQVNGGANANGSAAISLFYQTFQQTQMPEPVTLGVLLAGGIGLLARRLAEANYRASPRAPARGPFHAPGVAAICGTFVGLFVGKIALPPSQCHLMSVKLIQLDIYRTAISMRSFEHAAARARRGGIGRRARASSPTEARALASACRDRMSPAKQSTA